MADEVKIHVGADADVTPAEKKIDDLQKRIERLHRAADAYEAKGGMETAAKSARSDARDLEREVARMTKERASAEKAVTGEMKEQDALQKAGIGRHLITMRSLTSAGLGALAGDVFSSVVDQLAAQESLGNRRVSTEARNTRQATILNSIRGTSGQAANESWGAEENVAQLKRDRPQLQTDAKFNTLKSVAEGAAWGGGLGAGIGSIVPGLGTGVGMFVGAGVGALVKGVPAYMQGQNRLKQNEQDQAQEEERGKKLGDLAPKLFMEQEGGLELDKLRQRSKRTMAGSREAFADEMAEEWLKSYREIYNRTKDSGIAKEMADLTVQNHLRDKQAQAGAGLVDAKSGAGEIAAAAQWGNRTFGISEILSPKLDTLIGHVESGNQAIREVNQAK